MKFFKLALIVALSGLSLTAHADNEECPGGTYVIETQGGSDGRVFTLAVDTRAWGQSNDVGGHWGATSIVGHASLPVIELANTGKIICVLRGQLYGKHKETLLVDAFRVIGSMR